MSNATIITRLGHVKYEVLQRACLRDLPVDTSWYKWLIIVVGARRHISQVKDEIANLTEELILVDIPVLPVSAWDIRVCIK